MPIQALFYTMTHSKLISIFILLFFLSCTNKRKQKLWKGFGWAQLREIPLDKATISKLNDFDIVYQNPKTIDSNWNYPNRYVVGLYNKSKGDYDRIHYIEGINAFANYQLIKTISDFYTSDTTYLDNIHFTDTITVDNTDVYLLKDTLHRLFINEMQASYKMKSKKYIVLIYRKTDPLKRDKIIGEYMMWKREMVRLENDSLKTELLDQMNEHIF